MQTVGCPSIHLIISTGCKAELVYRSGITFLFHARAKGTLRSLTSCFRVAVAQGINSGTATASRGLPNHARSLTSMLQPESYRVQRGLWPWAVVVRLSLHTSRETDGRTRVFVSRALRAREGFGQFRIGELRNSA